VGTGVELVRRAYEAFNREDWDAAYACFHPEIEWHTYENAPEAGLYHGREAVRAYNERLFEPFARIVHELEEAVPAGDHVVTVTRQRAWPKAAGGEVDVRFSELYTVRDGLLAERRSYPGKKEALRAIGAGRASDDELEVARRAVAAIARLDVEGLLELCDEQVEFVPLLAAVEGGVWRGHQGVRDWLEETTAAFGTWRPEPEEFLSAPGAVVVLGRTRFKGRFSEVETHQKWGVVMRFREGKVASWRLYPDRAEALRAAGLQEGQTGEPGPGLRE
jgi:ketosteroid isomerase-like protein